MQSLPSHAHIAITSKFAQLEFKSPNGDAERGRTLFEGMLSQWPKRWDLWNVLLDMEIRAGDADQIRRLFERIIAGRGLKPKKAKWFFKRWLQWEDKMGDAKAVEKVKARAAAFVQMAKISAEE
jgi:rRNA biogenesis protein RRP5